MMDHPSGERTMAGGVWLARTPVLVAAALILLITGFNLVRLTLAASPRNPWEATQIVEGWRALQGMPVYELPSDGHSTQVYGALVPWLEAGLFRWVGLNNITGRLIMLVAGLATITLLTITMRGAGPAWSLVVAWVFLLGVNNRSGNYFVDNRPDLPALLFSAMGLLLMGYGQERRAGLWVVVGSLCLVVGFFFKQTAFIFSVVPPVALILRWQRPRRSEVVLATIPLMIAIGVIVALRTLNPTVYYYMIVVPKAFALNGPRAARVGWEFLINSPLFLVVVGEWIVFGEGSLRKNPRILWLFAALVVAIPYGAITTAKVGGWTNSFLPALLPLAAFCVLRLPVLLRRIDDPSSSSGRRFAFAAFVASLILMTTFPNVSKYVIVPHSPWQDSYAKMVGLAARLPGTVVCPEDPTIPLHAKQYAGRNVYSENDTHLVDGQWPTTPTEPVLAELASADYVIDVTATDGWYDAIDAGQLRDLGFVPAQGLPLAFDCYQVWQRKGADRLAGSRPSASLAAHPASRE